MGHRIFTKEYNGEELHDIERDISEAFDPAFNHRVIDIPVNDAEMQSGTFTISIDWDEDEDE